MNRLIDYLEKKVINAKDFIPQNRERVFIIAKKEN